MTPMTEPSLSAAPAIPAYRDIQRVTLPRVMRSEWTKLRSLPSTLWLLVATVIARRRRRPAGRPAPAVRPAARACRHSRLQPRPASASPESAWPS